MNIKLVIDLLLERATTKLERDAIRWIVTAGRTAIVPPEHAKYNPGLLVHFVWTEVGWIIAKLEASDGRVTSWKPSTSSSPEERAQRPHSPKPVPFDLSSTRDDDVALVPGSLMSFGWNGRRWYRAFPFEDMRVPFTTGGLPVTSDVEEPPRSPGDLLHFYTRVTGETVPVQLELRKDGLHGKEIERQPTYPCHAGGGMSEVTSFMWNGTGWDKTVCWDGAIFLKTFQPLLPKSDVVSVQGVEFVWDPNCEDTDDSHRGNKATCLAPVAAASGLHSGAMLVGSTGVRFLPGRWVRKSSRIGGT